MTFVVPGSVMSVLGALLLTAVARIPDIVHYTVGGVSFNVNPVKILIAVLMLVFACFELHPFFKNLEFEKRYIAVGGAFSGFFGGLSGHQGSLRSAFLAKCGLARDAFIGTNVACAVVVDIFRLPVYGVEFYSRDIATLGQHGGAFLIVTATVAAFLGSLVGAKLVKKVAMRSIQQLVGGMLVVLALALGAGLV